MRYRPLVAQTDVDKSFSRDPGTHDFLVIGDVHGDFDAQDAAFLEAQNPTAALFVGDFGDEAVEIVEAVSKLRCEFAVILGNHDGWFSYRDQVTPAFEQQLSLLGQRHVGYGARVFAGGRIGVFGGRPFSWGGEFERVARFARDRFGLECESASAERIAKSALGTLAPVLVALGHNGPLGLGSGRDAPFGRDFRNPPIDFGDSDLAMAIATIKAEGCAVPLCVAGHMHEALLGGGQRRRIAVLDGTLVVNAAVVPRHRNAEGGDRLRHFVSVRLIDTVVIEAEDLWVNDALEVVERRSLL